MERATPEIIARAFNRAARLIEQGWTKGAFARNNSGHSLYSTDKKATKFCMRGAVHRAETDMELPCSLDGFLCMISKQMLRVVPSEYNDAKGRTAKEVANFLRRVSRHIKSGKLDVSLYLGRRKRR